MNDVRDSAFGHVKRKFRSTDGMSTGDMMRCIDETAENTICIPSTAVTWLDYEIGLYGLDSIAALSSRKILMLKR
eukprot:IDg3394t1